MAEIETRRVCVLSTGHLTGATLNLLNATPMPDWPVAGGQLMYGFYVYAHDEMDEGAPADLSACCTWAHARGFDYIQFDADAALREELPGYEHGPEVELAPSIARMYGAALLAELRTMVAESALPYRPNAPHVLRARALIKKMDSPTTF